MKVIILHSDEDLIQEISRAIENAGHAVMATTGKPSQLAYLAAKSEPHLIVVGGDFGKTSLLGLIGEFSAWGYRDQVYWLKQPRPTAEDITQILDSLAPRQQDWAAHPYPISERFYFQDVGYRQYASQAKINRPPPDSQQARQSNEIHRLNAQLSAARRNHARGKQYLAAARRTHRGLALESTYRAMHGSFKVFAWRTQVFRYLAVLAHYCPGLEIDCLPRPCTPAIHAEFLHHGVPAEGYYALFGVLNLGIKEPLAKLLQFSSLRCFQGQEESDLIFEGVHQAGLAQVLLEVCNAQVRMMDLMLDPASNFYQGTRVGPYDGRREGTYADAWDFLHLRYNPSLWRQVARQNGNVKNGHARRYRRIPRFAEFLKTFVE